MEVVIGLFITVLVGGFVALAAYAGMQRTKLFRASLQALAGDLELYFDPGSFLKSARVYGEINGDHITVDTYTVSTGKSSQTFTRIRVQTSLPRGLKLKREGILTGLAKFFTGDDVEIGIDAFDQQFLLHGIDEVSVLSRMAGRSRRAISKAIGVDEATLKDGTITWQKSGLVTDPQLLRGVANGLIELAAALADHPGRDQEQLLRHAFTEPDRSMAFRQRCFQALLRHYPSSPEAAQALEHGAKASHPALRFVAARQMGDAGLPLVRQLLRDPKLPDDLRSEGAALLGPGYGGGLSVASEADGGELSVARDAGRGALSKQKA